MGQSVQNSKLMQQIGLSVQKYELLQQLRQSVQNSIVVVLQQLGQSVQNSLQLQQCRIKTIAVVKIVDAEYYTTTAVRIVRGEQYTIAAGEISSNIQCLTNWISLVQRCHPRLWIYRIFTQKCPHLTTEWAKMSIFTPFLMSYHKIEAVFTHLTFIDFFQSWYYKLFLVYQLRWQPWFCFFAV